MAIDKKCCFVGNGEVFIQKLPNFCPTILNPNPNPLLSVGNVTELNLSFETTEETVPNLMDGSFGNACSLQRLEQVNLEMVMTCFKTRNIELAMAGQTTQVVAGTVTDEEHYVQAEGELAILEHLPDKDSPIVVTGPGGAPVYTVGTDYVVMNSGIYLPEGTTITLPSVIEVDYEYLAQEEIDIAQVAFSDYLVHVNGINAANGEIFSETFFRVKFGPTDVANLISTTFGALTVTGEVLKDECHLDADGNGLRATFKMFP